MLEMKNISVSYGKETVISNASLRVQKGKLLSVIGINGSGKTTLLKATAGLIPYKSGEIILNGKAIRNIKRKELARELAYLPQGRSIPDMTVEQIVLHGRFPYLSYPRRYSAEDMKIAETAMKKSGVWEYRRKSLLVLSGGMRQKAYISMALAQDAEYILLDEPVTYLDINNQIALMKDLRRLAEEGRGVVSVMHDLPLAFSFSDFIAILHQGKIIACDTPEKLYRSDEIRNVFSAELEKSDNSKGYYLKL